ncbi:H/ACA ribonucleoprotein complex non-core subunit NAF1-like [Iris pallida]|uniref:H/ACA ribonucleoprotein complex non-core subunit NAF1 n=1 Tax=Iris pallida TaxID=29817 RepID=A0AAX6ED16_IRIPA|nr:H/ACA ribonucleoprotein complex non-core subunit NAF1-like [Iris pallida]
MLLDYYLNHHPPPPPLLSSPSPSPTKEEEGEEEELELATPLSDFDPVKEWLLDLDSPPPPSLIMMSSSLEPAPPSDADVVVVGSPIDAKMEKVTLVEDDEEERNCRLIENNKEEEEEDGVGGGGKVRNGGLAEEEETNGDDSTTVEKVKGDLTGEEKNDSNMEEKNDKDDEEEEGSSDESSSSSSSSSTSSSEEAEDEEEGVIKGSETEETLFISDDDDEEEGGPPVQKGPIRSKHELEDLPPVRSVEVSLEPHQQTIPLGVISSIFGSRVIIEGSEKHSALNEGSIIWITESRSPLGIVDEIFGPVKSPYYVIRYNSDEEVPTGISVGSAVSFVPEFAESVLNNKDLHKKGYDASGDNDEELSNEEFSDDEKEAEYRKSLREQKRATHVNHDSGLEKGLVLERVPGFKRTSDHQFLLHR